MSDKKCIKCNNIKSLNNFYKKPGSKDGVDRSCKECINKRRKEYANKNPNKIKNQRLKYYKEHYEKYYEKNKQDILVKNSKWRRTKKAKKWAKDYYKFRRDSDPEFKLSMNLRNRLNSALRNKQKSGSAIRDLGCSIHKFKTYIESQFKPGMSWENYGRLGWHIDHIIPLSKLNLKDRTEFKKAVHYSNLQPLWWYENLAKSDKVEI